MSARAQAALSFQNHFALKPPEGKLLFSNTYLRKLLIPLLIEQATFIVLMNVNTMMISTVGDAAVSAVALVDGVNMMVVTILGALSSGGSVIVSQYLGNKDKDLANRSASQLISIMMILSVSILVLCLLFRRQILMLFFGQASQEVMSQALSYFTIIMLSFPFMGLYNASGALFRTMGKASITMYVSVSMTSLCVVGGAIGIFVFHAGVVGIAVPTLIVRMVFSTIIFALVFNKKHPVWVDAKGIFSWSSATVRRILSIAIPNGIENGLFMLGRLLVTSIVATLSTAEIAAYGVASNIGLIPIVMVNAINFGMIPVVGQCVGAREYDQAVYYTRKLMIVSYLSTLALGIATIVTLPGILSLYTLSAEASYFTFVIVIIDAIGKMVLEPPAFNLGNAIRAAGDAKFTMYTGVISMFACRLFLAYVLCVIYGMGLYGVWIGMFVDWIARSVVYIVRFRSGKWKNYRAI